MVVAKKMILLWLISQKLWPLSDQETGRQGTNFSEWLLEP
jgi:hypothetical protein